MKDYFKKDNPQKNSTNIKNDTNPLKKAVTLKNGLSGSKVNGPIDQALNIWNDIKAIRQHSKNNQIGIAPSTHQFSLTICAESWNNLPQINIYFLNSCLITEYPAKNPKNKNKHPPTSLYNQNPVGTLHNPITYIKITKPTAIKVKAPIIKIQLTNFLDTNCKSTRITIPNITLIHITSHIVS